MHNASFLRLLCTEWILSQQRRWILAVRCQRWWGGNIWRGSNVDSGTPAAAGRWGLGCYMPPRVSCSEVTSALARARVNPFSIGVHQLYKSRAKAKLSPCMPITVAYFREWSGILSATLFLENESPLGHLPCMGPCMSNLGCLWQWTRQAALCSGVHLGDVLLNV